MVGISLVLLLCFSDMCLCIGCLALVFIVPPLFPLKSDKSHVPSVLLVLWAPTLAEGVYAQ